MGKFDHFKAAALKPGRLQPYTFWQLAGEPRVLIEQLWDGNATFAADMVARSNVDEEKAKRKRKVKNTLATIAENKAQNRKTVADHVIRHIDDVKHTDGTRATDADLAEFIASLPDDLITDVLMDAADKEKWREIEGDVEAIAKK
jgi:hypothetical protein